MHYRSLSSIQAYGVVPARSTRVSRVPVYSGYRHVSSFFAYGAFTLSGRLSQNLSAKSAESLVRSEPHDARIMVWPLSVSLAATLEIDVSFSSSGYLDVSVHRVPLRTLWIGVRMTGVLPAGFPHSDICGSDGYLLLPAAFRSLSRLSSALSAKASTLRSFLLDLSYRFHSVGNGVFSRFRAGDLSPFSMTFVMVFFGLFSRMS